MRLFSSLLLLSGAALSALAADVQVVNPPKEVKLNDRKHPITVQYSGVNGEADIHVDLLYNNQWMGGGQQRVNNGAGQVKVPIEVRVDPNFNGQLTLRAWASNPGANFEGKIGAAPDMTVGVSKAPTDAIGVLCKPSRVTPGQGFTLNLWYEQTHPRESDIIVVALHADTKQYFGGFTQPINAMRGQVSGYFNLFGGDPSLPLKFKAWISPRGEEAPNYVSYTMIDLPLGYGGTQNDCPNIGNQQFNVGGVADWVELRNVPNTLARGQANTIGLEYNLVSEPAAEMELSLMSWNWRTHEATQISSVKQQLTQGEHTINVALPVPPNAQPGPDGIYVIAFFNPLGKGYDDALAEDRKYKVYLGDNWANQASDDAKPRQGLRIGGQPQTVEVQPEGGFAGVTNALRKRVSSFFNGGTADRAIVKPIYMNNVELQ